MSENTVYIGIDPTAGTRPITIAVLDDGLRVLRLATLPFDEALDAVLNYPDALCAIDAPSGRNQGLLSKPEYRVQVGLPPGSEVYSSFRVCEYELRRRGIYIYNTSADPEKNSSWIEKGWELYERLYAAGYVPFPQDGARRLFETYPHAAFTVLIQGRPFPKTSLEGRLQRQLILHEEGLHLPDPMEPLGDITRYHLLSGQLEIDEVFDHDQLDALVAAYTAYVAAREPQNATAVGESVEGQIIIPTGFLRDSY